MKNHSAEFVRKTITPVSKMGKCRELQSICGNTEWNLMKS